MEALTQQEVLVLLEALDILEAAWAEGHPEQERIEKLKKLLGRLLTSLSPTLP